MAPDAPTYTLTDVDRALIDRARSAFAQDFRYLEEILWQARARNPREPGPTGAVHPMQHRHAMQHRQAMREALTAHEPRLLPYVAYKRGCWIWTGGLSHGDQPVLRLSPDNKVQPVRRWLYLQTHEQLEDGRRVLAGSNCQAKCIRPDHGFVLPPGVKKRREIKPPP